MLLLTAELTLLLAPTPAPYASAIYTMLPAFPVPLHAIAQPILRPIYAMVLLISGPVTASPQFIQIRTLHRLFTSLSIGISQLAGVWSTPSASPEQALLQATVMAKQLEADCESRFSVTADDTAVGEFHREVISTTRTSNPAEVSAVFRDTMQEGKSLCVAYFERPLMK